MRVKISHVALLKEGEREDVVTYEREGNFCVTVSDNTSSDYIRIPAGRSIASVQYLRIFNLLVIRTCPS